MSFTEKRLCNPTQLTTSGQTLYTVPASKTAIVKQIVVTNVTGSAATFSLYIGSAATPNALFSATSVAANDAIVINLSQVLNSTEILTALASANSTLNITISGVENDGPLNPLSTYIADGAITTAKIADASVTASKIASNVIIPPSLVDAKGDIIVGTADNTVARQVVGSNGQFLSADSSTTSGIKWDWGKIVQVVISSSGGTGGVSSTSQTKVSTGLSVTIIPKSSSNYIIYFMSVSCMKTGGSSVYTSLDFELRRNGTGIISQNGYLYTAVAGETLQGQYSFFYTDYPATTSSLTYELFFSLHPYANGTVYCQPSTGAGYQVSRLVALEVTP